MRAVLPKLEQWENIFRKLKRSRPANLEQIETINTKCHGFLDKIENMNKGNTDELCFQPIRSLDWEMTKEEQF